MPPGCDALAASQIALKAELFTRKQTIAPAAAGNDYPLATVQLAQ